MDCSKFKVALKDALKVLRLDYDKMKVVADNRSATTFAFIFLLVPAFFNLLFASFAYPSGVSAIFSRFLFWPMLIPVISLGVTAFVLSFLVEKLFHSSSHDRAVVMYGLVQNVLGDLLVGSVYRFVY